MMRSGGTVASREKADSGRPGARAKGFLRSWSTFALFTVSVIGFAVFFLLRNPHHTVDKGLHGFLTKSTGRQPNMTSVASCDDGFQLRQLDSPYNAIRSRLYADMAEEAAAKGITVLDNGEDKKATQNLTNDRIFDTHAGRIGAGYIENQTDDIDAMSKGIRPVHIRLDEPVRAVVIPLVAAASARNSKAIEAIHDSVIRNLAPLSNSASNNIWVQDFQKYHASIFHTSHHLTPTTARDAGVADRESLIRNESSVLREIFGGFCKVVLVLDRIIVTSGGAVLGLWQLLDSGDEAGDAEIRENDVSAVRERLRSAFPYAPSHQMSTPYIVHTTFARILSRVAGAEASTDSGRVSFDAVNRACENMMRELCGTLAMDVDRYWFVEERDLLALALRGNFTAESLPLLCN